MIIAGTVSFTYAWATCHPHTQTPDVFLLFSSYHAFYKEMNLARFVCTIRRSSYILVVSPQTVARVLNDRIAA